MKLMFWAADRDGVGFFRGILPFTALANRGHACMFDEALPEGMAHSGEFDVIVGQRVCEPGPSAIWQKLAAAGHTKLMYEIDDNLFSVDRSNKDAHAFYGRGVARHIDVDLSGKRTVTPYFDDARRGRIIRNIEMADAVTVSTEPLADIVSQWNPNVTVLPNMIPGWLLDHERAQTDRLITIGWRGGNSHSRDFGEVAAPLRRFLAHPGNRDRVEFHSLGADYTPRVGGRHARTRNTGWVDGVESFLRRIDFDAAAIPLRPSTFNDSKSDLALLEMSALGIPSIVSNTGPYGRAVAAGAPALTASTPAEWSQHLTMLVNEPETRTQLGKAAREWASTRAMADNAWRWEAAYTAAG